MNMMHDDLAKYESFYTQAKAKVTEHFSRHFTKSSFISWLMAAIGNLTEYHKDTGVDVSTTILLLLDFEGVAAAKSKSSITDEFTRIVEYHSGQRLKAAIEQIGNAFFWSIKKYNMSDNVREDAYPLMHFTFIAAFADDLFFWKQSISELQKNVA